MPQDTSATRGPLRRLDHASSPDYLPGVASSSSPTSSPAAIALRYPVRATPSSLSPVPYAPSVRPLASSSLPVTVDRPVAPSGSPNATTTTAPHRLPPPRARSRPSRTQGRARSRRPQPLRLPCRPATAPASARNSQRLPCRCSTPARRPGPPAPCDRPTVVAGAPQRPNRVRPAG
nr:lysine-rich arabinogalactan protein 19-like [Aegilops tauschii subsp. strangulata]